MADQHRSMQSVVQGASGDRPTPDRRERGSADERNERGVRARTACPHKGLGSWTVREERDNVLALIAEQDSERIPELVGLRHERMAASPFAFLRGSAIIMAHDLAQTPVTGIEVQAIGDAHIANFGMFQSHTRHLVFDVNDFDETAPGPWEWDIKRLAASVEVLGRERGFARSERKSAVRACAKTYRRAMARYATMRELDIWYDHLDVEETIERFEDELGGKQSRTLRKTMEKARAKDSIRAQERLTHAEDGRLRFNLQPPELVPISNLATEDGWGPEELAQRLQQIYERYVDNLPYDKRCLINRYHVVDGARKVVGVGSVGTRAWVALMIGRDAADPLMMQMKEAGRSVVERFWRPAPFAFAGERVVRGQQLVQSTSDILLGWTWIEMPGGGRRDYYVRQLWNGKGSIDLENIGAEGLRSTARLCARALAHAHARTGDGVAIAGYLGDSDAFEDAMWAFAQAYADQTEADYARFCETIAAAEPAAPRRN